MGSVAECYLDLIYKYRMYDLRFVVFTTPVRSTTKMGEFMRISLFNENNIFVCSTSIDLINLNKLASQYCDLIILFIFV